jgi:hypothetical protein
VSEDPNSREEDVVARAESELKAMKVEEPNWELLSAKIVAALPEAGQTESALLEPPLPTEADEISLDLASSTRAKSSEPSVEFGSDEDAALDEAWGGHPTSDPKADESPPATAAASTAYVATDTAVTESGVVESPGARQLGARGERSGERELVTLDSLIPDRGRERASNEMEESRAAATPSAAELSADKSDEHPASDATPGSQRDPVSLADLARSSVSRRSRDAASIAKESMTVARTHTGVAQRVHAADASANLPSVMIAPSPIEPATQPPVRERASNGPAIGAAIAIVGLAAGFALYIAGQRGTSTEPLVVTQMAPEPAADTAAKPLAPNEAKPVPAVTVETAPSPAATAVALGDEAPAAGSPVSASAARPGAATAPPASGPVAPERVVLNEDEPGVRAEKIVLDEEPSAPGATAAAKPKPTTESPPLKPAELTQGGLPDRPSSGAVQAAVGAVLGAARSCLAGQLEASSARVVFVSDGSVQSVQVSGPAAGTPAASCIESAFRKARVQPFAAPSFSLGTKVRPP